ncbi:MAG: hypothetical protein ACFWUK_17510 [Serratia liquefaciens]|jgi:transcriptional regulator with XRE-family HTH domain
MHPPAAHFSCAGVGITYGKGITQANLTEALGRPQSFIAKVENGERKLDVVEFAVITRLLGVDAGAVIERIGGRFHSL